jgi:hypothetical protein
MLPLAQPPPRPPPVEVIEAKTEFAPPALGFAPEPPAPTVTVNEVPKVGASELVK